jgi:hypothetical protein
MHEVVCTLYATLVSGKNRGAIEAVIYHRRQPIAGILRTDAPESTGIIPNDIFVA